MKKVIQLPLLLSVILLAIAAVPATAEGVDVPQEVYEEMSRMGYSFPDIVNAYALAQQFGSSPVDVITFKPDDMDWPDYGGRLQAYVEQRRLMEQARKHEGKKQPPGLNNRPDHDRLESREDVLVKWRGIERQLVVRLKKLGFNDEDILGILTIADMHGASPLELVESMEREGATAPERARDFLLPLNRAAGLA